MFDWLFAKEDATETEIRRLHEERAWYDPTTDEYAKLNARLKELQELKEMEHKPIIQVSGDTIVKTVVFAGVAVLIIMKEEILGPVTSKALNLLPKMI